MTTTATTVLTRHAVRCSTPGCSSFCRADDHRCKACRASYSEGCGDTHAAYRSAQADTLAARTQRDVAIRERDAARQAAVNDHAAHIEAMEEQERKADAVIAELRDQLTDARETQHDRTVALDKMRKQRDEQCKMANDLRAEVADKKRLLGQAREIIAERDRQIETLTRREANTDILCERLATTTREKDAALAQRDAAIEGGDVLAKRNDQLERSGRQGWFLAWVAVASTLFMGLHHGGYLAALAAVAGWGR